MPGLAGVKRRKTGVFDASPGSLACRFLDLDLHGIGARLRTCRQRVRNRMIGDVGRIEAAMSDEKIRVLQLCVTSGASLAAERRLLRSCHHFVRSQAAPEMDVSVAFIRSYRQADDELSSLAASLELNYYALKRYGRFDASLLWRLRRLIRRLRIDVVHAHDPQSHLLALLVQPLCGFRTVATAAEGVVQATASTAVGPKLLPGFHRVIAANKQLAMQLCQLGCRPGQVDVIRTAVDTEVFSRDAVHGSLRSKLGLAPDAHVVGTNYRLCRGRHLARLVEAIRLAEFSVGPIHLLLFADEPGEPDEPDWGNLERPAERVHQLGVVDSLPEVYAALSLFSIPGGEPDAIRALLEAQSMEVPVIGHRERNVQEVVAGDTTGVLIDPENGDALADAVHNLLVDRRRAHSLATAARLRVCQQFRVADHLHQIARTYRRAFSEA